MCQRPFSSKAHTLELSTGLDQNAASAELLARLGQSRTILVVEDNSLVRRATCEVVRHSGHRALEAASAAVARVLFARNSTRIDAVVCDAVLPDASGTELCRSFQRKQAKLVIVLTSGYPRSASILQRDSRVHFLEKPYSADSLVKILGKLFATKVEIDGTLLPGSITQEVQNLPG